MKIIIFLSLMIIVVQFSCSNIENPKVIFRSDFENIPAGKTLQWKKLISEQVSSGIIEPTNNAHSGKFAFKISRIWADGWSMAGIETDSLISLDSSKKYLLDFWYKTDSIFEYPLPLTVRFKVMRKNHDPLNYSKDISWSENRWQQSYFLLENLPDDAVNVSIRFYTRHRLKGSIIIDDVVFQEATQQDVQDFEKWRRQEIPNPLGNAQSTEFNSTGFFHLQKDSKRWWLIKPDGIATWSIGTMAAMPNNSGNGNVELYNWYQTRYGENRTGFANMLFDTLKSWGFNSYAGWTSDNFAQITKQKFKSGEDYFPMFRVLGLSAMGDEKDYYVTNSKGESKNGDHSMADPFNPDWRKDAREKAEKQIPEYRDEPWFAGWYVDNEIEFNDLFKFVWAEYSGKEFIRRLQKKYESIDQLNKTWSSGFGKYNYSSFEEILQKKPEPKDWTDQLYSDFTEFERTIIKEYIHFTYDLIKELDPHHLVISNRLNLGPMGDLYRTMDLWGKYDLICMNIYPENLLFGFSPGELELMKRLYEGTGKPVIIGEWSVPAISEKLYGFGKDTYNRPLDWSWPQVVRNQTERGEVYRACMNQLASMDFIVGAGWFKPIDVNSPVRRANRGLIDSNFQPYNEMIKAIKETNFNIQQKLNM